MSLCGVCVYIGFICVLLFVCVLLCVPVAVCVCVSLGNKYLVSKRLTPSIKSSPQPRYDIQREGHHEQLSKQDKHKPLSEGEKKLT